jgi:protoporphyrinogen oxidase
MSCAGPVVVIGGGPCGLAAAWHLARQGAHPMVVECEDLVGGLCATHERGGWRFDLGGHRFVSSDVELSGWIERLLGDDLLEQERRSVVLHEGRSFRYPLEPVDLIRKLGVKENIGALVGYAKARLARRTKAEPDRSFEDWVLARFGRPLYERFFGPYTHKLWGIHPRLISADWAAERISLLNLGDVALRLAHLRRTPTRTYARRYRYPRLGMGHLYLAMAREITRSGGAVRTGARVVGIETEGLRVVAVRVETAHGPERIPVGQLVSTMPLPELVRYLRPTMANDLRAAAARLRFRALTFVNLMLRRANFSQNTWMYVASGDLRVSRIQEPKRRSPSMAPPQHTSLMLEVPCTEGDAIWNAHLDELREGVAAELSALGFVADDVSDAFVVRVAHGYPVYHLDYDRDRRLLLQEVDRFSNVLTAGRQGLFRYIFMDAAMKMGIRAAEQVISRRGDSSALDVIGRSNRVLEASALTA